MDRGRADSDQLSIRWSTLAACGSPRGDSLVIHFASCVGDSFLLPEIHTPPCHRVHQTQGLATPRIYMVSINSGSPRFHHTQGLHGFTKLKVSMFTPNSGSTGFRQTQSRTKVRVSMISPDSVPP